MTALTAPAWYQQQRRACATWQHDMPSGAAGENRRNIAVTICALAYRAWFCACAPAILCYTDARLPSAHAAPAFLPYSTFLPARRATLPPASLPHILICLPVNSLARSCSCSSRFFAVRYAHRYAQQRGAHREKKEATLAHSRLIERVYHTSSLYLRATPPPRAVIDNCGEGTAERRLTSYRHAACSAAISSPYAI